MTKYIEFFKRYRLTAYEVEKMSLEELHRLFKADQKPKSEELRTLEQYFPYFDKELRKTGVTRRLLWECSLPCFKKVKLLLKSSPSGASSIVGP